MRDQLVGLDGPQRAVGRHQQEATIFGRDDQLAGHGLLFAVAAKRDLLDGQRRGRQ